MATRGGVHVYLRGVGSANHTELGDPAVAFHVDEVYSPRPQGATVLMYDVSSVEVLRGPQGTLFGRNSTAGTVNIVTAKPETDEFDAYADVTVGDYDRFGTRGMVNVPISETFALRAAVATENRDGFVDFQPRSSAVGSRKYGAMDQEAVRVTALWEASERRLDDHGRDRLLPRQWRGQHRAECRRLVQGRICTPHSSIPPDSSIRTV